MQFEATVTDSLSWSQPKAAAVIAYANALDFHIRLAEAQSSFAVLKKEMKALYEKSPQLKTHVSPVT